jgi:hypothetical protein
VMLLWLVWRKSPSPPNTARSLMGRVANTCRGWVGVRAGQAPGGRGRGLGAHEGQGLAPHWYV